jgi:adenosylcobinamide-phosphate synthase
MIECLPIAILLLAFSTDIAFGDPPNRFHPVAWMGTIISKARWLSPSNGNTKQFLFGLTFIVFGVIAMVMLGLGIERICRACPSFVAIVIQACVLKCTFSVRSLSRAAKSVEDRLRGNDLSAARYQVAYHLVSRDVSTLDASDLSAATIESIAENTSDSVVAPLFYFAIAGLPGALAYRFVNTCDAMLGYRTPELEWLGKPAARLDDLLNLIPARLTAVIMLLIGGFQANRFRTAVQIWWRDHTLTSSPNAGHPMSAAAGVLGVSLEKKGHYLLGKGLRRPNADDIEQGRGLLWITASVSLVAVVAIQWARGAV